MRRLLELDNVHVGSCTGITQFKAVKFDSCLAAGAG